MARKIFFLTLSFAVSLAADGDSVKMAVVGTEKFLDAISSRLSDSSSCVYYSAHGVDKDSRYKWPIVGIPVGVRAKEIGARRRRRRLQEAKRLASLGGAGLAP